MATEEMTAVAEPQETTQPEVHDESQYSIYNYFKEHTAFFVACVSACVAVITFALNYAANQYTSAYLQYWMVDTVYAKDNKTELVYTILFTLLYGAAIVVAHKVTSGTANAFGIFNRILSALKWYCLDATREFRVLKQKRRKMMRGFNRIAKKSKVIEHDPIYKAVEQLKKEEATTETALRKIRDMRRTCTLWVTFNTIGPALVVFGIVLAVASLMAVSKGNYRTSGPLILAGIIVVFDLLLYFVPVCRSSRIKKKNYKDVSLEQIQAEIEQADMRRFPLVALMRTSAKELLSNKRIKQIAAIALFLFVTLIGSYLSAGKTDAAKNKEFPVFVDETGTYVAVYNNGETLVLKSANIDGTQIDIDVRRQRVISATDVAYEICTFETVIVTGKDGG